MFKISTLEPKPFIWAGFIFADFVHQPINIQKSTGLTHARMMFSACVPQWAMKERKKKILREKGALKPKGFSSAGMFMCQQDCRLFILHFTFGIKVLISFHVLKQQTTLFLIKHLRFEMSRVRSLQVLKLDIKMNVCLFCLTKNLRIRFF